MHVGTNSGQSVFSRSYNGVDGVAQVYPGLVRFNNVFADVRANPANLFSTPDEHRGTCRTRSQGGVTTYTARWQTTANDGGSSLIDGGCHVGGGTMLCSANRVGSRFSNGGTSSCTGTGWDSIYWAWDDDDHDCHETRMVGTGCGSVRPAPTFRSAAALTSPCPLGNAECVLPGGCPVVHQPLLC